MIEAVMIFALGFLAATLAAIVVLPAVNRRAERLIQRRLEARFPLSIAELTAEKDHLRAEFAVALRRLEQQLERSQRQHATYLAEIGRRAATIAALEKAAAERRAAADEVEARLAENLAALEAARLEGERLAQSLKETGEALAGREEAFRALETAHRDALIEIDTRRIAVAGLETQLANRADRIGDLEQALAAARSSLAAAEAGIAERDSLLESARTHEAVLTARIRALDEVRAEQAARIEALEASEVEFAAKLTEASALASRRETTIAARDADLAHAHDLIARLEAELAATDARDRAHASALEEEVELMRAEKLSLEGALQQARADRARLQRELSRLQRDARKPPAEGPDDATLLQRIDQLADAIMASPQPDPRRREDDSEATTRQTA